MTTHQPGQNPSTAIDWASLDPLLADDRTVYSAARVRELIAADRAHAPRNREASMHNPDKVYAAFKQFALGQGYDLTTCEEKGCLTTSAGVGPATFWNDATEHAWRGWANRPVVEDSRVRTTALGTRHWLALRWAQSAACTCLTKTPEIAFHQEDCRYRVFAEIEQALSGAPAALPENSAADVPPALRWPNGSENTVPAALRYLANHPRPHDGAARYNAEHLLQLAGEIEEMAKRVHAHVVAAPQFEAMQARAHAAERGCYRAGLLFDVNSREWQPAAALPGADSLCRLSGRHLREVRLAQVAACTCATKTPDIGRHRQDCRYRVFAEVERFISGFARTTAQDMLKWARENESLLNSKESGAIDAAVQRFIAAHAGDSAVQRYECTPKNGGAPYIIERAPDSWELRECDIRPAPPVVEPAAAVAWTPGPGEAIAVCIDHALERAATLLRRTGYSGDAIDASRLEYLREHPAATLPDEPDRALLCSMAVCLNHGFGLLPAATRSRVLDDMRKLYDEVAGRGYYQPDNRERYLAWLPGEAESD